MALSYQFNVFTGNFDLVGTTSGGGALAEETPVGAVNGSNVTYTVTHDPLFLVSDGVVQVSGVGYTYVSPTITMNALIPPVQYIRSYYSS